MVFDSKEEMYFSWYLEDLKAKRYVKHYDKCIDSFKLTDGFSHKYIKPMKNGTKKEMVQTIFRPSIYTPDFVVHWEDKAIDIFVSKLSSTNKITTPFICCDNNISIIETKADYDMANMTRLAKNNIKFVYEKYNQYVNLIKLPELFKKTFTPDRYFMQDKTFKPRKFNYKPQTLREYVNNSK